VDNAAEGQDTRERSRLSSPVQIMDGPFFHARLKGKRAISFRMAMICNSRARRERPIHDVKQSGIHPDCPTEVPCVRIARATRSIAAPC
jgi:hypothetical protein